MEAATRHPAPIDRGQGNPTRRALYIPWQLVQHA